MRDVRRIRDRVEFRVDRMQMIWLSLGGVLALAVMFALGVLVGERAERLEQKPVPAKDPIAALDEAGSLHDELTFYSKLTAKEAPPLEPAPKPAVPEPLEEPKPVEKPKPPEVSVAAEVVGPPNKPTTQAPIASDDDGIRAALAAGPAELGEYTVQVSAFQTDEEARAYAAALERKGYKPFIVAATIVGKGTWYRVRIGSFKDEAAAVSAKNLLARADIPAWVLKTE